MARQAGRVRGDSICFALPLEQSWALQRLATVLAMPAGAQQDRMQGGTLECSLSSSIGMVVTSTRNVACNFKPKGGPPEAYVGTLTRVGLDIGVTGGGAIIWGVFTSTNLYAGMLTGTYVGASAETSIAAGLGANVAGRRLEPFGGAAAAFGAGPDRAQYRGRRELAGAASRPVNCRAAGATPRAMSRPLTSPADA